MRNLTYSLKNHLRKMRFITNRLGIPNQFAFALSWVTPSRLFSFKTFFDAELRLSQ